MPAAIRAAALSGVAVALFFTVEGLFVLDSLMYHWFTAAAGAATVGAIISAWQPALARLPAWGRTGGTLLAGLAATLALVGLSSFWPDVLVYEGGSGVDAIRPGLQIFPAGAFATLAQLPQALFGRPSTAAA